MPSCGGLCDYKHCFAPTSETVVMYSCRTETCRSAGTARDGTDISSRGDTGLMVVCGTDLADFMLLPVPTRPGSGKRLSLLARGPSCLSGQTRSGSGAKLKLWQ